MKRLVKAVLKVIFDVVLWVFKWYLAGSDERIVEEKIPKRFLWLVFAGNHEQYVNFLVENHLRDKIDARYITDTHDCLGWYKNRVIFVKCGTWYERTWILTIAHDLAMRGYFVVSNVCIEKRCFSEETHNDCGKR